MRPHAPPGRAAPSSRDGAGIHGKPNGKASRFGPEKSDVPYPRYPYGCHQLQVRRLRLLLYGFMERPAPSVNSEALQMNIPPPGAKAADTSGNRLSRVRIPSTRSRAVAQRGRASVSRTAAASELGKRHNRIRTSRCADSGYFEVRLLAGPPHGPVALWTGVRRRFDLGRRHDHGNARCAGEACFSLLMRRLSVRVRSRALKPV